METIMKLYAGHLSDKKVGIAKPFEPRSDLPERPADGRNIERIADEHHPTQGAQRLSKGTLSDRAARHSRTQWSLWEDHHEGWHGNRLKFFAPTDLVGRFKYVAFMAALCLPDECIGFKKPRGNSKPEPYIGPLTPAKKELIWERGDIKVESPVLVSRFLTQAVAQIGVLALHTGYDESLTKKFKDEPDEYRGPLMRRLAELAANVTGLEVDYSGAREAGFLPPNAPVTAKEFLIVQQEINAKDRIAWQYPNELSPYEIVQKAFVDSEENAA